MNEGGTYSSVASVHPYLPDSEALARQAVLDDVARKLAENLADGNVYAVRIRIDGPELDRGPFPFDRFTSAPRVMRGAAEIRRVDVEPSIVRMVSAPDPRQMALARLVPSAASELWSRVKRTACKLKFWNRRLGEPLMPKSNCPLRPVAGRLIVREVKPPDRTPSGIVLPDVAKEKPKRGTVLAAGPSPVDAHGNSQPFHVVSGDEVIYGGFAGTTVEVDGDKLLILKFEDVLAVVG